MVSMDASGEGHSSASAPPAGPSPSPSSAAADSTPLFIDGRRVPRRKPEPPEKPDPDDCCGSGCSPCIFDIYYTELEDYEKDLAVWEEAERRRREADSRNYTDKDAPAANVAAHEEGTPGGSGSVGVGIVETKTGLLAANAANAARAKEGAGGWPSW
ncbi:unnamed protein product [Vitrella brassicaformis CCMP3155]|uniref:Oxidoreductase-like domain-containing protein n=1 Tax=Vitrella brassicaformis (strain CCMP3155) TaxID=1169540 RepID=A0A0G4FUG5_VITBC|nr:unnamed protein product [Vitrella brassicaformis CCMP3155]|eukprot:CEM18378.1 unnamed protein product [Vitrella brassicaformis CCMP3155]